MENGIQQNKLIGSYSLFLPMEQPLGERVSAATETKTGRIPSNKRSILKLDLLCDVVVEETSSIKN